jgi:hypothetical protein
MGNVINDKHQHDQATHHHVPRRERRFDVLPVFVGLRPGTPILNCQQDREVNVKNDRGEKKGTNQPEKRAEIEQVLRVSIDPIRPDKNLQIAKQMSDHKKNQNDSGDRDDHFFSNR